MDLANILPLPHPSLEACVVIPCKNEAERLPSTLTALSKQVDLDGRSLSAERWELILLINNSTDGSRTLASCFKQNHPHLNLHLLDCDFPPEQAHVGHARKLLMDTAGARLHLVRNSSAAILSTDADTVVDPDWIAQNLSALRKGVDAAGGRILIHQSDLHGLDEQTRRIHTADDRYRVLCSWLEDQIDPQPHDRWPRHHQCFAASLAVRPESYLAVGGLPPAKSLEDVAFYRALLRHDMKFRHCPDICVHTAGRLDGKTEVGLAEQLSRWSEGPSAVEVPSVAFLQSFFGARRTLRELWTEAQAADHPNPEALNKLAEQCRCGPEQIVESLACKWFGTCLETLGLEAKLEGTLPAASSRQKLEHAVAELRRHFAAATTRPELPARKAQSDIAALETG